MVSCGGARLLLGVAAALGSGGCLWPEPVDPEPPSTGFSPFQLNLKTLTSTLPTERESTGACAVRLPPIYVQTAQPQPLQARFYLNFSYTDGLQPPLSIGNSTVFDFEPSNSTSPSLVIPDAVLVLDQYGAQLAPRQQLLYLFVSDGFVDGQIDPQPKSGGYLEQWVWLIVDSACSPLQPLGAQ